MKPDEPGIEDDEPGGFIAIVGHFRRRPMREGHGNAQGEMAGARFDRASRLMNPSLHPYLYNAASSPTMLEATGENWRPWAPAQAGSSMGAELQPPKPDRGPRSGHEPADITGQERPPLVTSPIADPNDWRPARPTKARLMAGR